MQEKTALASLNKDLADELDVQKAALEHGNGITDFPAYQRVVGRIEGLKFSLELVRRMKNKIALGETEERED